jgi:hypothetical protein
MEKFSLDGYILSEEIDVQWMARGGRERRLTANKNHPTTKEEKCTRGSASKVCFTGVCRYWIIALIWGYT